MHNPELLLPRYLVNDFVTAYRASQQADAELNRIEQRINLTKEEETCLLLDGGKSYKLAARTAHANFLGELEALVRWVHQHKHGYWQRVTSRSIAMPKAELAALAKLSQAAINAHDEARQRVEEARAEVPDDGMAQVQFAMRDRIALLKPSWQAHEDYRLAGVALAQKLDALLAEKNNNTQEARS